MPAEPARPHGFIIEMIDPWGERRFGGTLRAHPELTHIMRKGLDALSEAEAAGIAQRWLVVNVQPGVPWRKVLGWGGPLLLAVLVGMGLLRRSQRKMAEARGRRLAEASSDAGSATTTGRRRARRCSRLLSPTAAGMSPQELEQEQVFEPYAQGAAGEKLGQGVGLGLAISRQIVAAMGGTLQAQSTLGQGSTFFVRVPPETVKR